MIYTDKQALIERFGADRLSQLTDRVGDGDLDDDVLARAIADAERLIDSYLMPRYRLPLDPALIAQSPLPRKAGDLVMYYLHQGGEVVVENEAMASMYREVIAWLKDVQQGRASLGEVDTGVATPEGRVVVGESDSRIDWGSY